MAGCCRHIFFLGLVWLWANGVNGQSFDQQDAIWLKGSVVEEGDYTPVSGVRVATLTGWSTTTNGLGEFRIQAKIGDVLVFEGVDFNPVRHKITSDEDIRLVLRNDSAPSQRKRIPRDKRHEQLLDSAKVYAQNNIQKSIDFVAQSITVLGKNPSKRALAQSLTALGEVYLYHKQYDLAIANFEDALKASKKVNTQLLLGEALIADQQWDNAERELRRLEKEKGLMPYQRIRLNENLGNVKRGLGQMGLALEFYKEGLRIAQKNQMAPKITDLTSKIAETYASVNKSIEAEGYFGNSLALSKRESPKRAIQESEKVADFYKQSNRFSDEIQQRKSSLNELRRLNNSPMSKGSEERRDFDTITTQRINYKIGKAYLAQNKLEEAIPYFEKSIVEAGDEDDLIVQKDATRRLSEVYKYKGDFPKAFQTYQDYVALVDTLYTRKEQELGKLTKLNLEIATKKNRISSLEQEWELSQSKYSLALTEQQLFETRAQWQKWLIYSLIAGMLLLALTAFFFYRSNRQQHLTNNLLALKSLRSQMNPHFIFNALNSVNTFIAKNDERSANRFLSEFSVLMRTVLENSEEDFIPLNKELELLQLYIKLEHSRFTDKFDYDIVIAPTVRVEDFQIPPMLLQPYIENAIWHGLRYKKEKGFLKINVNNLNEDMLLIEVLDNGIGRKQSKMFKTANQKKQKSKGMANIKERVAILNDMYKNKLEVSIADLHEDNTGTKVTLTLKKDK